MEKEYLREYHLDEAQVPSIPRVLQTLVVGLLLIVVPVVVALRN